MVIIRIIMTTHSGREVDNQDRETNVHEYRTGNSEAKCVPPSIQSWTLERFAESNWSEPGSSQK